MSTISPITPISPTISNTNVGLGYGIAIAISILFLISTIVLASYACIKSSGRHEDEENNDVGRGGGGGEAHSHPRPILNGLPGPMIVKVCWDKVGLGLGYQEVVLGESKRLPKPNNGPCSICLSEYRPKQIIRCMPDCNHCFHVNCIDQWLKMSPTCPLCRSSPATTPLSEFVPLPFQPR